MIVYVSRAFGAYTVAQLLYSAGWKLNMTKSAEATPEQEATRVEFINSHIKRFDTDGDGKVSYAEGWGAFNKRMVELVTMDKAEL